MKRPAVVTIAAILLIVLALLVAGLGIASQYGLLGRGGFGNRTFVPGQFRNRGFNPQNGGTTNNGPIGTLPNDQGSQGTTPNFTRTFSGGTGLTRLFRLIRPITIGLDIVLLVLSGIAAFGIFKGKRWGVILAIVLAVIIILLAIPSLLRIFSALVLIENLVRILLAVTVIVLLLLPISRKAFATADDLAIDE